MRIVSRGLVMTVTVVISVLNHSLRYLRLYPHDDGSVLLSEEEQEPNDDIPVVSFIIPSTLTRESLNQTLQSLLNQKNETNWEAIVGVDTRVAGTNATKRATNFLHDPRIRYVPITTPDSNRGKGKTQNGSGQVRNQIIQQHARAKWVAFVDDDDTLSPWYAKKLFETIQAATAESPSGKEEPDIIIWRMRIDGYDGGGIRFVPPMDLTKHNVTMFKVGTVGISFAAQRDLFTFPTHPLEFKPSAVEDYAYLKVAFLREFTIRLSTCVLYFVRHGPLQEEPNCHLEDSTLKFWALPRERRKYTNLTKSVVAQSQTEASYA